MTRRDTDGVVGNRDARYVSWLDDGANVDRLVEVKKAYDPDNLFRVNRNVAPAGRGPVRQDIG